MPPKDEFTGGEMEMVMSVFKQYETGLREACIDVKVDILKWFILGGNDSRTTTCTGRWSPSA